MLFGRNLDHHENIHLNSLLFFYFLLSGNPFNLPRDVLGIKCMLQRDYDGLKKVISAEENPKGSIYALQGFRCPDKQETVLHAALQANDEDFVKLILAEIDSHRDNCDNVQNEFTILRAFAPNSKLDKEAGNFALLRKNLWGVDWRNQEIAAEIATYACHSGCLPEETVRFFYFKN